MAGAAAAIRSHADAAAHDARLLADACAGGDTRWREITGARSPGTRACGREEKKGGTAWGDSWSVKRRVRRRGGAPWPPNLDLSRQLMQSPAHAQPRVAPRDTNTHTVSTRHTRVCGRLRDVRRFRAGEKGRARRAGDGPQSVARQAVQTPHAVHRFLFESWDMPLTLQAAPSESSLSGDQRKGSVSDQRERWGGQCWCRCGAENGASSGLWRRSRAVFVRSRASAPPGG